MKFKLNDLFVYCENNSAFVGRIKNIDDYSWHEYEVLHGEQPKAFVNPLKGVFQTNSKVWERAFVVVDLEIIKLLYL